MPNPLVFVHIPKTGGTSTIHSITQYLPEGRAFIKYSTITPEIIMSEAEEIANSLFISGHFSRGAAKNIRATTNARMMTVVRSPREHAVSIYLHACRDMPGLIDFGIKNFLKSYKYYSIFQSASLLAAFLDISQVTYRDVEKNFGAILNILSEIDLVFTTENLSNISTMLSSAINFPVPLNISHLNSASSFNFLANSVNALKEEYDEVSSHPSISHLVALEQALYLKAHKIYHERLQEFNRSLIKWQCINPKDFSEQMLLCATDSCALVVGKNWRASKQEDGRICWWTEHHPDSYLHLYTERKRTVIEFEIVADHFVREFRFSSAEASVDSSIINDGGRRRVHLEIIALNSVGEFPILIKLELPRGPADIPKSQPWIPSLAVGNFKMNDIVD